MKYRTYSGKVYRVQVGGQDSRGTLMVEPNPMQSIFRRQLGVDAFALDGDETQVLDPWSDRPRKKDLTSLQPRR
jgi:hypothetical protein